MRSNDLAKLLRSIADLRSEWGAPAKEVSDLATVFDLLPTATVAAVIKRLEKSSGSSSAESSVESSIQLLRSFAQLLRPVSKAGVAKDLELLAAFLDRHPTTTPERLLRALTDRPAEASNGPRSRSAAPSDPVRVDRYVQSLTSALSQEAAFAQAYEQLAADTDLPLQDLKEIAKRFARSAARSREDALKKIRGRHQNLMAHMAKSRATGGRSAA